MVGWGGVGGSYMYVCCKRGATEPAEVRCVIAFDPFVSKPSVYLKFSTVRVRFKSKDKNKRFVVLTAVALNY